MTPDAWNTDDTEHRLLGREVVHAKDIRRGTVA